MKKCGILVMLFIVIFATLGIHIPAQMEKDGFVIGDVNGNGTVDMWDAVLLAKYCISPDENSIHYSGSLDFNESGNIEIADAKYLFGYVVLPSLYPLPEKMEVYYTVTFEANGADVENLPKAQIVKAGECATEPEKPTRLVHEFSGWYTDSNCTNSFSFDIKITENITLYANWISTIYGSSLDENHIKSGVLEYEDVSYEGLYIDNELIIEVDDGTDRLYVEQLVAPYGGKVVGQIPTVGFYQVEFEESMSVEELDVLVETLKPYAIDVDKNYVYESTTSGTLVKAEPYYADNPAIELQYARLPHARNLLKITNKLDCTQNTKIGIIDAMFAVHEDINYASIWNYKGQLIRYDYDGNNVWDNPEIANTTDDKLYMYYAHGTHVAGITAAIMGNSEGGISGICHGAQIYGVGMHYKDTSSIGKMLYQDSFRSKCALSILIESNVFTINYSMGSATDEGRNDWTNNEKSNACKAAGKITRLLKKYIAKNYDFLIVVAAGNERRDSFYSTGFTAITDPEVRKHIIVVGAVNAYDMPTLEGVEQWVTNDSSGTNTGNTIDVYARGLMVYSTVPTNSKFAPNGYTNMTGTSMATPMVTGLASLLKSIEPSYTSEKIKNLIIDTANVCVKDVVGKYAINIEAAVAKALDIALYSEVHFYFTESQEGEDVGAISNNNVKLTIENYIPHGSYIIEDSLLYNQTIELSLVDSEWDEKSAKQGTVKLPYGVYELTYQTEGYEKVTSTPINVIGNEDSLLVSFESQDDNNSMESSPFEQTYWVIFAEGFRNNRIEASTIDSPLDSNDLYIKWSTSLELNQKTGASRCNQYYLNENNEWIYIGNYTRLTDKATTVLASNLDIYDKNGNIILKKCNYEDIDLNQIPFYTKNGEKYYVNNK